MGGGDLNSKKSWHPNTIKNQERVWKAEQAASEEKKRIVELQRERAEERDRNELNCMIKQNTKANMGDRLHWMYDKPDKKEQQEEYLLGKAIDKNSDHSEKTEADAIPAVARRVIGSSMLSPSTAGDPQVDLLRKIREDPLLLIKERERAARAALLNNPLQRRKIAELLRKEQDQKKDKTSKKHKKKDKDLDNVLAAKLNALSGEKGLNLASLLDSDDSSSDSSSSSEEKLKKKKKNKKHGKKAKLKKKKKKRVSSDTDVGPLPDDQKKHIKSDKKSKREVSPQRNYDNNLTNRKRYSSHDKATDNENNTKRSRQNCSPIRQTDNDRHRRRRSLERSRGQYPRRNKSPSCDIQAKNKKREALSEEQRAAKLAAMVAAGAERETERGRRVAQQREADEVNHATLPVRSVNNEARSLPDSLESRIHSNRHYIQRNSRHMNEHFARR